MGQTTSIQWTDATWNPVRGCSRVSEGCRNCYAERQAARFAAPGIGVLGEEGKIPSERPSAYKAGPFYGFVTKVNGHAAWTGKVELVEKHLLDPLKWKDPRRVFVNSMSDLFHENLSFEDIDQVFAIMGISSRHTYQILTKRPKRMFEYFSDMGRVGSEVAGRIWDICDKYKRQDLLLLPKFPLPNVWLGVSVEDQKTADERIPLLLQTPAAIRFVSYEPALGPVDFERGGFSLVRKVKSPSGKVWPGLNWIIVGGESGPGARPFDIGWAWTTIEQCRAAGVACFVKQLGAVPITTSLLGKTIADKYVVGRCAGVNGNAISLCLDDKKGGDWDEWPRDLRVREFPLQSGAPR